MPLYSPAVSPSQWWTCLAFGTIFCERDSHPKARMAERSKAHDSRSCPERVVGSNPTSRKLLFFDDIPALLRGSSDETKGFVDNDGHPLWVVAEKVVGQDIPSVDAGVQNAKFDVEGRHELRTKQVVAPHRPAKERVPDPPPGWRDGGKQVHTVCLIVCVAMPVVEGLHNLHHRWGRLDGLLEIAVGHVESLVLLELVVLQHLVKTAHLHA